MSSPSNKPPRISIVIPIYNEEAILEAAVKDLLDRLSAFEASFELILAENGSKDATVAIASELSKRFSNVRSFSLGEPNYGKALKRGILEARGDIVICDEIDLCDTDFYRRALTLLESDQADLVVGSKVLDSSNDERPFMRHFATLVINGMLRVALGFKGTDTHGLKAFRRASLVDVVEELHRRQGPVRQRAGDPRRARGQRAHQGDPGARAREAATLDPPVPARAQRAQGRRAAGGRDPHQGLSGACRSWRRSRSTLTKSTTTWPSTGCAQTCLARAHSTPSTTAPPAPARAVQASWTSRPRSSRSAVISRAPRTARSLRALTRRGPRDRQPLVEPSVRPHAPLPQGEDARGGRRRRRDRRRRSRAASGLPRPWLHHRRPAVRGAARSGRHATTRACFPARPTTSPS